MTKGQKAMAYAKIYQEGKKGKEVPIRNFSKVRLSVARTVLRLAEKYDTPQCRLAKTFGRVCDRERRTRRKL